MAGLIGPEAREAAPTGISCELRNPLGKLADPLFMKGPGKITAASSG